MSGPHPFALTTPCSQCPFLASRPVPLRPGRVREIEQSLDQHVFPCHKLLPNRVFCAGALIVMEKNRLSGNAMRMGERLGLYDPEKLDMEAPVFENFDAMEAAMHDRPKRRKK